MLGWADDPPLLKLRMDHASEAFISMSRTFWKIKKDTKERQGA